MHEIDKKDMFDMFRLYPSPEWYVPCNKPMHHKREKLSMMAGETTVHSFDIPFDVENECLDFRALYKLGTQVVLTKTKEECDVTPYVENCDNCVLSWTLSPNDTLKFADTFLDAKVQIEFVMADHSIAYTDILDVKVTNAVNSKEEKEKSEGEV